MRDRSKQLLVINTGKKDSGQTGLPSQSGTTHIIGGGGLSVNMSDYLLKSIWDKVWEIRTDSQGTEYIFGKLPMVTQYGITMYSGDGVDVPSLASGLPFDGRTIWYNPDTQQIEVIGGTGGGSGEGVSNFWDLSGIPSWITNTKPKYTYSEIEGTPDLTKYALVSQIPSLSGYATESWVNQQNYAIKATTLSGYGITDAYTKTNVDDLLKSYVTLGGTPQTITGEKNFTGGLKVNGSPIYYDTEKKYWKFEGDLLVTGGVTMYGNEGTFTPSTIMDAILYDDATLGINSNGQLYVKGGNSGGGLDITALQNYLTQNSYLNVTEGDGRYLKLSGGTINGKLTIKNSTREVLDIISTDIYGPLVKLCYYNDVALSSFGHIRKATESNLGAYWMNNESGCGIMLGSDGKTYIFTNQVVKAENEIWHKGNFTPSNYLPLSGGTLTGTINTQFIRPSVDAAYQCGTSSLRWDNVYSVYGNFSNSITINGSTAVHAGNISSYNAGSATRIQAYQHNSGENILISGTRTDNTFPRYIYDNGWGLCLRWQEGNGVVHNGIIATLNDNVASATKLATARTIWGQSFDGTGNVDGDFIQHKYGAYGGNGSEFNIYNKAVADVDGREGSLRWVFENAYARFRRLEIWSQEDGTSTRLAYFSNSAWSFYAGIGDSMFCGGHAEGYALYVGSRISDANKYLFTVKYGQSTLGAGGNTALHVRGNGSVGVNTDSPRCKFSVISVGTGSNPSLGALATVNTIGFGDNAYKTYFWTRGTGNGYIQVGREDGNTTAYHLILQALGGNVGVGKEDPQYKVDIVGNIMVSNGWYRSKGAYGWYSEDYAGGWYMTDAAWIRNYNSKPLLLEIGTNNTNGIGGHRVGLTLRGTSHCSIMMIGTNGGSGYGWGIAANADGNFYVGRRTGELAGYSPTTDSYKFRLDGSGNGLFYGGVTMYSDQRKKTILNHVELSLKQIADAPLIEHYYNSDESKTTHVGSIAQYWASMNDWFCKLDNEGYYTMEIQNAALASAISIARELDRYETKTDKAIKKLKERIRELEEEVELLKAS